MPSTVVVIPDDYNRNESFLIGCFLMEKHHRHFLVSFMLHTLIYGLLHMVFAPRDLAQAYIANILLLLLASFGSARKLPLLIFPSVVVKFICFSLCAGVAMLSLSETSITMKTRDARMEFRRQRNYPEIVNLLFEEHPTVCIWIHGLAVIVALDLNMGLKAFYNAFNCMHKVSEEEEEEKPPSYAICVTNSSQTTSPPTYDEAILARQNQIELVGMGRKNDRSNVFVV